MTEQGLPDHRCTASFHYRGSSAVAKDCCRLRRGSAGFPLSGSPVQRTACGTHRTKQLGQALTEMGLVVALCVLLTLGIVEFGYTFMALNLIKQATSRGARAASVHQMGSRGLCGKITNDTAITAVPTGIVAAQIGNIATILSGGVTVTQNHAPHTIAASTMVSRITILLTIAPTTVTILNRSG